MAPPWVVPTTTPFLRCTQRLSSWACSLHLPLLFLSSLSSSLLPSASALHSHPLSSAAAAASSGIYSSCDMGKGRGHLFGCGNSLDPATYTSLEVGAIISSTRNSSESSAEGPKIGLDSRPSLKKYLIKLVPGTPKAKMDEICSLAANNTADPGQCIQRYDEVFVGALIRISGQFLFSLLGSLAQIVEFLEVDGTALIAQAMTSSRLKDTRMDLWGLDRIDQVPGGNALDGVYRYRSSPGTPVHVYVVDTGIRCSHREFQYLDGRKDPRTGRPASRCQGGFSPIKDRRGTDDCNGHGSHCAGTVAGLLTGVAKHAIVHPIRVMGCDGSGTYGDILAGLDWVARNYIAPAVISMSIAMPASISLDTALSSIITRKGIVGVAAAGNFHSLACNFSPADSASVITVAASTRSDNMASFSNFGSCVHVFAPGQDIMSVDGSSDSQYAQFSGTSQACPHVAGAAAVFLSTSPNARPNDVRRAILDTAFSRVMRGNLLGTPNRLLSVNFRAPLHDVSPRTITGSEASTVTITVALRAAPSHTVTFRPSARDASIVRFSPPELDFPTDAWSNPQAVSVQLQYSAVKFSPSQLAFTRASWKKAQRVRLQLSYNANFLDRTTLLAFNFESKDAAFQASLEGILFSLDRDVCKAPCGQSFKDPKVVPRLPFYYEDDSNQYSDRYSKGYDGCHDTGPDVVFQFKPATDMTVTVELCGRTAFDTTLSAYTVSPSGRGINGDPQVRRLQPLASACNDDACGVQSRLSGLLLQRGVTYAFAVDGWAGAGGPFSIRMTQVALPSRSRSLQAAPNASVVATTTSPASYSGPGVIGDAVSMRLQWSLRAASWGPCSIPCVGGTQIRNPVCLEITTTTSPSGNASVVSKAIPSIACRKARLRPPQPRRRTCQAVACSEYRVMFGPWGECSVTCGSGTQTRLAWCADSAGLPVRRNLCPTVPSTLTSRECSLRLCGAAYWAVPRWQPCNLPCGGGQSVRPGVCVGNPSLSVVDASQCHGLPEPPRNKTCNSRPCATFSWAVGPWGECNPHRSTGEVKCQTVTGTRRRPVLCVDVRGTQVSASSCNTSSVPRSKERCCHVPACCRPSATWRMGRAARLACTCPGQGTAPAAGSGSGVEGAVCGGLLMRDNGKCCSSVRAVLDKDGRCCESGVLDGCGSCNSSGRAVVDSLGACCWSGVRDALGLCCASARLDECGVCNGDGTSCLLSASLTLLMTDAVSYNETATRTAFHTTMSRLLLVVPEAVEIFSLTRVCSAREGFAVAHSCSPGTPPDAVTINFTVAAFAAGTAPVIITQADFRTVIGALSASQQQTTINTFLGVRGASFYSLGSTERTPVCGNGVCEIGEQCRGPSVRSFSAVTLEAQERISSKCCQYDCPFAAIPCPAPASGPRKGVPCSGAGRCLDSSGECDCYFGHSGGDCSTCLPGYVRHNGTGPCYRTWFIPKVEPSRALLEGATVQQALLASNMTPVKITGTKHDRSFSPSGTVKLVPAAGLALSAIASLAAFAVFLVALERHCRRSLRRLSGVAC